MKQTFIKKVIILFVFLAIVSLGAFSQVYSLDDDPTNPANGPFVPTHSSAEDEFGFGLPAWAAGFIGPSPSLFMGFFDSDVLFPGPALSMRFNPAPILPPVNPPGSPSPYYVDAYSADHSMFVWDEFPDIWLRFSVDRATGGINNGDASFNQAMNLDQPADIFQSTRAFQHPAAFMPLPAPVPPWIGIFGGVLPTAGGGGNNVLVHDNGAFGLVAGPWMNPGTHDNIDAYNELPNPDMLNQDIYYALHPAEAFPRGISASEIYYSPPGPLNFIMPPFANDFRLGLNANDSIDGLIVWDYGTIGVLDPGTDFALFSLAPGSQALGVIDGVLTANGFPRANPAAVFLTNFQGYFYLYAYSFDLGVGNQPSGPLPGIPYKFVNIDALEMWFHPW